VANTYTVVAAAYGALIGGNENNMGASEVTHILQVLLDNNPNGVITIDNTTMGSDPASGNTKHFGAIVIVNGERLPFACEEGQTIDFS
jgi:hypothetical protein